MKKKFLVWNSEACQFGAHETCVNVVPGFTTLSFVTDDMILRVRGLSDSEGRVEYKYDGISRNRRAITKNERSYFKRASP